MNPAGTKENEREMEFDGGCSVCGGPVAVKFTRSRAVSICRACHHFAIANVHEPLLGRVANWPRMQGQTKSQLHVSKYCPLMVQDGVAMKYLGRRLYSQTPHEFVAEGFAAAGRHYGERVVVLVSARRRAPH